MTFFVLKPINWIWFYKLFVRWNPASTFRKNLHANIDWTSREWLLSLIVLFLLINCLCLDEYCHCNCYSLCLVQATCCWKEDPLLRMRMLQCWVLKFELVIWRYPLLIYQFCFSVSWCAWALILQFGLLILKRLLDGEMAIACFNAHTHNKKKKNRRKPLCPEMLYSLVITNYILVSNNFTSANKLSFFTWQIKKMFQRP